MKPLPRCLVLPSLVAALGAAGCVSLDEPQIPSGAVRPDQRTAVLVFPSPGPWVTQEAETKAESAAKILPGVGQLMQSVQDDGDLKTSNELRQYYNAWPRAESFRSILAEELAKAAYPGATVSWVETGAPPHVIERFNRAESVLDWRRRYLLAGPLDIKHLRDYSQVLEFDGHLVLEVNLQYGLMNNAEGNVHPALRSVSRLYRANTMKLLWSHEDGAEDKTGPRNIYEYKASPPSLSEKFDKLAMPLAAAIAGSLRSALSPAPDAGAPSGPARIGDMPPVGFEPTLPPQTTSQAEPPLTPPATGQAQTPSPGEPPPVGP
ncbi:MAG: hypothetical protein HY748_16180 [Elusimicrobia bacterium]|nr:hypothetical protein [Elusimicrobiota bacterium]